MAKDDLAGALIGIFLGFLGLALLVSLLTPRCPNCRRPVERGTRICPYCRSHLVWE